MNSRFFRLSGILAAAACLATLSHAAVLLEDQFTTLDTDTWYTNSTGGAYSPGIAYPDLLRMTVSSPNGAQRTFITSKATDINPFTNALTVSLQGLGGVSMVAPTSGSRSFFAIVGMANSDTIASMYPNASSYTSAGALALMVALDSSGAYSLQVFDYGATSSSVSFGLSSLPTDIAWTIDGAAQSWSVTVTGTTFSGGGTTQSGSFTNYTEGSASHLSIGAMNYEGGTGTFSTSYTDYRLNAVTVTSVPEPSGAAAMGGIALLVTLLAYRRRMAAGRQA